MDSLSPLALAVLLALVRESERPLKKW